MTSSQNFIRNKKHNDVINKDLFININIVTIFVFVKGRPEEKFEGCLEPWVVRIKRPVVIDVILSLM